MNLLSFGSLEDLIGSDNHVRLIDGFVVLLAATSSWLFLALLFKRNAKLSSITNLLEITESSIDGRYR